MELIDEVHFKNDSITFIDLISENTFFIGIYGNDNLIVYQRASASKPINQQINQLKTNGALKSIQRIPVYEDNDEVVEQIYIIKDSLGVMLVRI